MIKHVVADELIQVNITEADLLFDSAFEDTIFKGINFVNGQEELFFVEDQSMTFCS